MSILTYCHDCKEHYRESRQLHVTMSCPFTNGCPFCGILGPTFLHPLTCQESADAGGEKFRWCQPCGHLFLYRDWRKHKMTCPKSAPGPTTFCDDCKRTIPVETYADHRETCSKPGLWCHACEGFYQESYYDHREKICPWIKGCAWCHKKYMKMDHQDHCIMNPNVGGTVTHENGLAKRLCHNCCDMICLDYFDNHVKWCMQYNRGRHDRGYSTCTSSFNGGAKESDYILCGECNNLVPKKDVEEHMFDTCPALPPKPVSDIKIIDNRDD